MDTEPKHDHWFHLMFDIDKTTWKGVIVTTGYFRSIKVKKIKPKSNESNISQIIEIVKG